MLNPYLFYNDNCEAAFRFYEKVLGGKIEMMLRADEGPADMKPGPGREKLIMHARKTALGFYGKLGYSVSGDEFTEVTIPHFVMEKSLG